MATIRPCAGACGKWARQCCVKCRRCSEYARISLRRELSCKKGDENIHKWQQEICRRDPTLFEVFTLPVMLAMPGLALSSIIFCYNRKHRKK